MTAKNERAVASRRRRTRPTSSTVSRLSQSLSGPPSASSARAPRRLAARRTSTIVSRWPQPEERVVELAEGAQGHRPPPARGARRDAGAVAGPSTSSAAARGRSNAAVDSVDSSGFREGHRERDPARGGGAARAARSSSSNLFGDGVVKRQSRALPASLGEVRRRRQVAPTLRLSTTRVSPPVPGSTPSSGTSGRLTVELPSSTSRISSQASASS
jgi:hypothetical protein